MRSKALEILGQVKVTYGGCDQCIARDTKLDSEMFEMGAWLIF